MTTDTRTNIQKQKRDTTGKLVGSTPTLPIMVALDDAFTSIRAKHPELENVVLVVGTSGYSRRGQTHGHFAPNSWDSKSAKHEIMLSGESLKRGAEETLATLLHEAAHALGHIRGIKDTSREGRFHNKRFKLLAEELGIEVENDKTIGWSVTRLPKTTAVEFRKELTALRSALKAYRIPALKPTRPSKDIRVECGCRAVTLPITFYDKGTITCDECSETFLPIEKEEDE